MALTLNNFWGCTSDSHEDWSSGPGTGGNDWNISAAFVGDISPFAKVGSGGPNIIFGFRFRGSLIGTNDSQDSFSLTNGTNTDFTVGWDFNFTSNLYSIFIKNSAGTVVLTSSIGITEDVAADVELYVERADSGAAEIFINGVSGGSTTGQDFRTITSGTVVLRFDSVGVNAEPYEIWDMYFLSGCTSAADRLKNWDINRYRSTKVSATPDDGGSNLTTGTWDLVMPSTGGFNIGSGSVQATYDGGPIGGAVDTDDADGSTAGGPLGDTNIGGRRIIGLKGYWKAERGSGAGTDHRGYLGNNVDGAYLTADFALATTPSVVVQVASTYPYSPFGWAPEATTYSLGGTEDFFMRPDGTQMYTLASNNVVREYDLAAPFNPRTATSTGDSFTDTQSANPTRGLAALDDGTKFYVKDTSGSVFQYDLSTAWLLSSAAYASKSFAGPIDDAIYMRPGGVHFYAAEGGTNTLTINRWVLSTAGDISTAGTLTSSSAFAVPGTYATGMDISSDGKYILATNRDDGAALYWLATIILDTAWDVTTARLMGIQQIKHQPSGVLFVGTVPGEMIIIGQHNSATTRVFTMGIVPTLNEYCRIGMWMSGARDFELYAQMANVLHVPGPGLVYNPGNTVLPHLVR